MRLRKIRAALAAVGALVLLAGCTTIPSSGEVQVGLTDLEQSEQTYQFNPNGPTVGASQEDLVRAFLRAGSSSAEDYSVAREFLTPDYAKQWDPRAGVLVYEGARPYTPSSDSLGVLEIDATAKVSADGTMLPVEPGPKIQLRFEFERIDNEWRIASAPSGIVLDSSTFSTIWSPFQLYFIGPDSTLVPETRWFLKRTALATEIVGALIAGPSELLRDSVHTAFPSGTTLVGSSVPIVDGRAQIDLSNEMLNSSPEEVEQVRQQLKNSLQYIDEVRGFDLLASGTPIREGSSSAPEVRVPGEATNPAVLSGGKFGTVVSGEFREMEGFAQGIGAMHPTAVTLAPDEHAAAVQNAAGISLTDANGTALLDARPGLLAPSFDIFGYVWTAQADTPQVLAAYAQDGTALAVAAPWLKGRKVLGIRVSPEGSRIAALVAEDGRSAVYLAGVVRDDAGVPMRTSPEANVIMWADGEPIDFDWIGTLRIGTLTRTDSVSAITSGGPGYFAVEQGSVPGGLSLSGGGVRAQLRVLGENGGLYSQLTSAWQRSKGDIQLLAKRG